MISLTNFTKEAGLSLGLSVTLIDGCEYKSVTIVKIMYPYRNFVAQSLTGMPCPVSSCAHSWLKWLPAGCRQHGSR